MCAYVFFFFFQAEDGIRDPLVTGVQTCALPIASPLALINTYLAAMAIEADQRGYSFDRQMVGPDCREIVLRATQGQLAYEPKHPLRKLWARSPGRYARWRREAHAMPHSRFKTVPGIVESWEHKPDGVPHR